LETILFNHSKQEISITFSCHYKNIMDTYLFSLFAPILVFVLIALFKKPKKPKAPEPSGAWPIIGHLHLLGGKDQLLYRTLGEMANRYGPAMSLRLGSSEAFVVSSFEVAKECFTVNDKALASRPMTAAAKHMGYNFAVFGFAPYSSFWREMRKIATVELLSNRRLQMLKHVRVSEISMGVKDLYSLWAKKGGSEPVMVDLKRWLEDMTLNMIVRMVAGKRYFGGSSASSEDTEEAMQCKKAIAKFFHLIGIFTMSDAFPTLGWFDPQGHEKEMKKTGRELDVILERWIETHRQQRKVSGKKENDSDFIDVMLSLAEQGKLSHLQYDANTSIKSTCLALILGGSDTTASTLTWAIALLLNNKEMLKKAQDEIDLHVGTDRNVEDSDIENLVYLQAIIKETLRLYPAGPLLGPREAMEDCTVASYHVSCGTRLIVNVWKIQRDPKVWMEPNEFRPERFLTGEGKEFDVLHLGLASFLQSFEVKTVLNLPVDMSESPGLTIPKATPLEVLISPRLDKQLFVETNHERGSDPSNFTSNTRFSVSQSSRFSVLRCIEAEKEMFCRNVSVRRKKKPGSVPVHLNVYDLTQMNMYGYWLGIGIYHSGLEVHGVEYGYGAHEKSSTGIFEVEPRKCPGFTFRKSILVGETEMKAKEVRSFMEKLGEEYQGNKYHLITRNCNHFCNQACLKLTQKAIPSWVNRLARLDDDEE
ncbi:unnamed protein product, partial [Thlaspi arvense]